MIWMRFLRTIAQRFFPGARLVSSADVQSVAEIRRISLTYADISDAELTMVAADLRSRARSGQSEVELAVEAMAVAGEAVRRRLGIECYDVQILAALAMGSGAVAELAAGEGKTIAAALCAFLHALSGRGVHVVTSNHYLASRDQSLLGPVFTSLGMKTSLLSSSMSAAEKQSAYSADIVYGVSHEFGFDYLRAQMQIAEAVQPALGSRYRELLGGTVEGGKVPPVSCLNMAIIDEIDSVLIDEASSPLIVSRGRTKEAANKEIYLLADRVSLLMEANRDFVLNSSQRTIALTDAGLSLMLSHMQHDSRILCKKPFEEYVEKALIANLLMEKDVQYIIADNSVCIVDAFTGRRHASRSWGSGLHQAVQAKEGLTVHEENVTAAQITRQRYFSLYESLAGMTGTTAQSEREFMAFYKLPVFNVPSRMPSLRVVLPTRFFCKASEKWEAIAEEALRVHSSGQPILIGTRTVEDSQILSEVFTKSNIEHTLLNAKQDQAEALVISQAGHVGRITIATNMSGRGADIPLTSEAEELGGLYVALAERYEAKRIDDQLMGRCARQGQPGTCRGFVSLEDPLIEKYGRALKRKHRGESGEIFRNLQPDIDKIQRQAEKDALKTRWKMLQHDRVLSKSTERAVSRS